MATLNFKGKTFVQNHHLSVKYHQFVPKKDKSFPVGTQHGVSLNGNLIIHGDKPDIDYLKSTALTLDVAKSLGTYRGKKRLVFAPSKYLDTDYLLEYRIDYCQLPFEIYKLRG
jgi:hypothetical protein